jgi:predicted phage tail protein
MITFQSSYGAVSARQVPTLATLGQDEGNGLPTVAAMREKMASEIVAGAHTYGILGTVLGAAAMGGVSYAGLRWAGTKNPGKGALAFGGGALVLGATALLMMRYRVKEAIANPPETMAGVTPVWFHIGLIAAT